MLGGCTWAVVSVIFWAASPAGQAAARASANATSESHVADATEAPGTPATDAPAVAESPIAIATGLPDMDAQKIYVGKRYKLLEGMTDEGWAQALILARNVGNRSGIENAYGDSSYERFEVADAPTYLVQQQDPVGVENEAVKDPIACKLDDGTVIYATELTATRRPGDN
jgi:hypothetical protein